LVQYTTISDKLVATDEDDDDLTFRLVNGPNSGTVTINPATGAFTYTPNSGPRRGGIDRFTYVASDGMKDGNVATVRIDMTNNPW
jgi:hypothetical protein